MRMALLASTAICGLLFTTAAQAQTPGATPAAPAASADASQQIAEIVVTAQRRSENLQKAAIAVSAVSGDAIAKANISTTGQLAQLLPSLSVQNPGGANTTFFVRGVGNFTVNGYSDPAIAFNYDGVYIGRPTSTSGFLYDLQRVELLPGPQGTLYGRNATAGALNVIPVKPQLGQFGGFAQLSYGAYNAVNLQGAVNAPVGEKGAFRVAGNLVRHDGYLSDGASDQNDGAVRVQYLQQLADDLTVRIGADWSHQGGKGGGSSYALRFAYNPAAAAFVTSTPPFDASTGSLDPRAQAYRQTLFAGLPGRNLGLLEPDVFNNNSNYGVDAEIEWKTPQGTLTVIPSARAAIVDNKFPTPAFIGFVQERDTQQSLEARFAGNRVGLFDYIVGAYYFHEDDRGNYTFSQDALAAYQTFDSGTNSYAGFARATAHLSERLRLVGGVRYTSDRKTFDGVADVITVVCQRRVNFVPSCPTAPVLPVTDDVGQLPFPAPVPNGPPTILGASGAIALDPQTRVNKSLSTSKLTGHAGVEFDLSPTSLLYAAYENGYRSGGFALSAGYETFQPEYIDAYTLGAKNRFFSGRLQLNAELFWWKYTNQQVNHTGIDINGNQGQFTQNIGNSTNRGVQVDLQAKPARDTVLSANVQYLDAAYDSFVFTVPIGNAPPLTGCKASPTIGNAATYTVDCSGKTAFNAPRWTLTLGGQQTVHLGDFDLVLSADTQFKTSQVVGFDYLPVETTPDYWSSNVEAALMKADSKRWSVALFARNLENRRIVTAAPLYNIGGVVMNVTTAPRTYGIRLMSKF